ncbi:hypothetical protein WHI96_07905 [Pseudonocardia tropica]|uniref:Tail assembly chaperone E/41/14-like protein n=1 Tax=Pseudonocardia tropica TaxID=681289 RepID=A0ABV1JST6_9PSEU
MSESLTSTQIENTAQAEPKTEISDDGIIRLGGGPKKDRTVEMVPLFAINGKTYKVPKKLRPNVGLSIISHFEQLGPALGQMYLLRRVLGQEALDALLNYDDLDPADMKAITDKLTDMVFGSVEEESGN